MNTERCTPRHTIVKMSKIRHKERILKKATKKERVGGGILVCTREPP